MRPQTDKTPAAGVMWALTLLGALLLGAGAKAPRQPWFLTTDGLPEYRARALEEISTYPQALATTVDIMQRDLGLPTLNVRLIFLPGAKDLETLLLGTGYPPKLARDTARQLVAIGGHRIVLINQARFERRGWSWRLSTLAHELAHVLQYEVGGGKRGTSAQWLREGFAEWLEIGVMEALEEEDGAKARKRAIVRLRSHARRRFPMTDPASPFRLWMDQAQTQARMSVPALSALGSFPDWVEQSRGEAGPILYDYAFIAADFLIEEQGVPAVIRYFELFSARQDHAANFLEAFGETEEEFEERLHRTRSWSGPREVEVTEPRRAQ